MRTEGYKGKPFLYVIVMVTSKLAIGLCPIKKYGDAIDSDACTVRVAMIIHAVYARKAPNGFAGVKAVRE